MKKVVYIEIDEEITSIYDRIRSSKQKEIYLVIPRKAIVFHSLVNLRILKEKMEDIGKRLIFVTTDHRGQKLADQVGIAVVSRLEIDEKKAPPEDSPEKIIQPIQAKRNEVMRDTPRRTEKKLTIRELIEEFRQKDRHSKKFFETPQVTWGFGRPNRKLLALIFFFSLVLFSLISYIALPGATVYVKPKFDTISHTVNLTLADRRRNQNLLKQNRPNVVASETIEIVTKQTKIFDVVSKEFEGRNSKGTIKIINTTNEEWTLKPKTRFQSPEGLIFVIPYGVNVPAATVEVAEGNEKKINGMMTVPAEAEPFDVYGDEVGDRGNIGPTRFIIPGLSKYNQKLIWAESSSPMTGGETRYFNVVSDEDIESAKKQIQDNLILIARDELKTRLDEINKLNQSHLMLLDDRRYLKTELLELRVPDDIKGTRSDKFEIFAKVKAVGVAYDSDQLFSFLKSEIGGRTHPDRGLQDNSVKPDTISYEVIDENPETGQIKLTATITGIEEYLIDETTEAGLRFTQKVRDTIKSLEVREAEGLVANFPEVDAVMIKTWPFWVTRLPRLPENIKVTQMSGAPTD